MANFEAVKTTDGKAVIVDTRTPGDGAHGRIAAECPDIGTAVELVGLLNS